MTQTKPQGLPFLWISLLVIVLDQVTKYLCVTLIEYGTAGINVLPFFNLVHVYNFGAAFSFLADKGGWQRWFFAALAVVISLGFIYVLKKTPRSHKWTCLAYALFIGGAIGNLIDRLFLGYVVDFLLFYLKTDSGILAYPAFNVADIAVCVGAFLLVIVSFGSKKTTENKSAK